VSCAPSFPMNSPINPEAGKWRIGVVTGSRADYGLLYHVLKEIEQSAALDLRLFVTGMHLAPEFGSTWKVIEADGFRIQQKVDLLVSGDDRVAVTKSIGLGVIGFADAFERCRPDLVLVLGDRFEILAAVQACLIARIPVAHIAGGDTTEGAFDESIRHAITKMSHLHFVTNEEAAGRVKQMGENPDHVHNVGSPGVDFIKNCRLLSKEQLSEKLGILFAEKTLLVTFHPATLDSASQTAQMNELLEALDSLGEGTTLVFTMPNADTDGRALMRQLEKFADTRPNAHVFTSLGQINYLSMLAQADAVVGNSSSGLYEAPSLRVPTVNIGDRQKGRLQATSIVNCPAEKNAILTAIRTACEMDVSRTTNPYGDGGAAKKIAAILSRMDDPAAYLQKHFHHCAQ
jgi:UDP-hydrolysing UDP-N-acetyl-D-glucosamine 2-epimerase